MTGPRPTVATPPPWRQPLPTLSAVGDGLTVAALDLPGQPVGAVRLVMPVSLAEEVAGSEGATAMMARLLDEGCAGHTAEDYALALERRGVVLGTGVVDGAVSVDLDVPVRRLADALELLRLAVCEPTFPQDQIDRIVRSRVAEIAHESASAPHRAAREMTRSLWAADTRSCVPVAGTVESVESLARPDLLARHARLGPSRATLVVAGQLTGIDVAGLVGATFAGWSTGGLPPVIQPPRPAGTGPRVVLVDRPGSVQSELLVATPAPGRADGHWAAFPVLAYLLGGSPNARIDAVLREEKGWTYGLRCGMRPRVRGGSFVVSGSVRADVTAPALESLVQILDSVAAGFAAAEVSGGVDFITRATPGRWATADVVADETAALAMEGLPWDFPAQTVDAMLRLTPDDLAAAWARIAAQDRVIVVVGDAQAHAQAIGALGLGEVDVLPA